MVFLRWVRLKQAEGIKPSCQGRRRSEAQRGSRETDLNMQGGVPCQMLQGFEVIESRQTLLEDTATDSDTMQNLLHSVVFLLSCPPQSTLPLSRRTKQAHKNLGYAGKMHGARHGSQPGFAGLLARRRPVRCSSAQRFCPLRSCNTASHCTRRCKAAACREAHLFKSKLATPPAHGCSCGSAMSPRCGRATQRL